MHAISVLHAIEMLVMYAISVLHAIEILVMHAISMLHSIKFSTPLSLFIYFRKQHALLRGHFCQANIACKTSVPLVCNKIKKKCVLQSIGL